MSNADLNTSKFSVNHSKFKIHHSKLFIQSLVSISIGSPIMFL